MRISTIVKKRISQLAEQLSREEAAFDEVSDNVDILFDTIRSINMDVEAIEELYNRVYERFGFENWTQRLQEVHERLSVLNDMRASWKRSSHKTRCHTPQY